MCLEKGLYLWFLELVCKNVFLIIYVISSSLNFHLFKSFVYRAPKAADMILNLTMADNGASLSV